MTISKRIINTVFPDAALESEVRQHINRALSAYATSSESDQLWGAAWMLKNERNAKQGGKPINCGNKALSYAEHYMLARAFTAEGGSVPGGRSALGTIAMGLVAVYDLGKLANAMLAVILNYITINNQFVTKMRRKIFGLIYQLGDCPMSDGPPNPIGIAWAMRGINDGMAQPK